MANSDKYRIAKHKLHASVRLLGSKEAASVQFFLADYAAAHGGPERVLDLLMGPDDVIPAEDAAGATAFIQRSAVLAVAGFEDEGAAAAPEPGEVAEEVEVALVDGTRLRGTLRFAPTDDGDRLLEHLLAAGPWLRLHQRGGVALLAARHVARIALAPTAAAPKREGGRRKRPAKRAKARPRGGRGRSR